jgi:acyl-[acyl carrier protein]--UDP-N-acetylglucosamine O-acyltransferase
VSNPARRLAGRARREVVALRMRAAVQRDTTPPLSGAYGAYGEGTLVLPPARVQLPHQIRLGTNVTIHEHAWLCLQARPDGPPPRLSIGDGTRIGRGVKVVCMDEVVIGSDVLFADFVYIADTDYSNADPDLPVARQPRAPSAAVRIGDGSFLGIRAQVHPGVTLGERAYVAGGAVVTEDVEPFAVVAGNPARVIRRFDPSTRIWRRA